MNFNYDELTNKASLTKLFHAQIASNETYSLNKSKMFTNATLILLTTAFIPLVSENLSDQQLHLYSGFLLYSLCALNMFVWLISLIITWVSLNQIYNLVFQVGSFMRTGTKVTRQSRLIPSVLRVNKGSEVEIFFDINGVISSVLVSQSYASLFRFDDCFPVDVVVGRLGGSNAVPWVSACKGCAVTLDECISNLKLLVGEYPSYKDTPWFDILSLKQSNQNLHLS